MFHFYSILMVTSLLLRNINLRVFHDIFNKELEIVFYSFEYCIILWRAVVVRKAIAASKLLDSVESQNSLLRIRQHIRLYLSTLKDLDESFKLLQNT